MPEEFDLESFDAQWEQEQAQEIVDDEGVVGDEIPEDELQTADLQDEENTSTQSEEIPQTANDPDVDKRNAAFAQLRRERDDAKKFADFLHRIAEENGTSVDEMMNNYEQTRLQEQAETQGVPVEVLKRLKATEQELETVKNQSFTERFNREVEATISKYNATQEDVEATFAFAHQNGLADSLKSGLINFEAVHKMAHLDSMIEKAKTSAVQENLSQKKKRQQEAPLNHSTGVTATVSSLEEQAIADAKAIMESGGF